MFYLECINQMFLVLQYARNSMFCGVAGVVTTEHIIARRSYCFLVSPARMTVLNTTGYFVRPRALGSTTPENPREKHGISDTF